MYKLLPSLCLLLVLTPFVDAKIVFKSERDGNYEIYVMDDDGSNVQRLTNHPDDGRVLIDGSPAWSPDGTHIAFDRMRLASKTNRRIEQSEIFIMNSDGSEQQNIISLPEFTIAWHAAWSPDGQRIAFSGNKPDVVGPSANIFTFHLGSKKFSQLTRNNTIGISAYRPAWSPNGGYIAYVQTAPKLWRTVYTMKSNGTRERALIPADGVYRYSPQWSPDGQQLLYGEGEDGPDRIILQNLYAKKRRMLKIPQSWVASGLRWMGRNHVLMAAYEREKPGSKYDIYQYNLITDEIINLTNSPGDDVAPDWIGGALSVSPHGKLTTQWGKLKQPTHAD